MRRKVTTYLNGHPWMFSVILITLVGVPGFIALENVSAKTDETVSCVQDWADKTAARSAALGSARDQLDDATDALILSVGKLPDQKPFADAYVAYVTASDKYHKAAKNHPIPRSPEKVC